MEKVNVSLANQIRFIRELQGFSQDSLASYLGISQQAYQKLESGKCRICKERLQKIAEFLNVDLSQLSKLNREELLARFSQKGPGIHERLRQQVLSMQKELSVLQELNHRILLELESSRKLSI